MSNTGQIDLGFNGDYHHDVNLLMSKLSIANKRIAELENQVDFEKGLSRIKSDEYDNRIAILEGDVKYMTGECEKLEKANAMTRADRDTLRMLDELVGYRQSVLSTSE